MVNHIVMWNFQEELTEEERIEAGQKIKTTLEGLKDKVEGVLSLQVINNQIIDTSNKDIMLFGKFVDEAALERYQKHPEHIKAGEHIRAVTYGRVCMDYEESE